jgi:glycosidase
MEVKPIIYQVLPRLFGNTNPSCVPGGTLQQNGCGKFEDFTNETLSRLKSLGVTHIWFTGVIRHATCTPFESCGIGANHPDIVKGEAGSPYAITDYFDVAPSLANDPMNRMKEFEELVIRCKNLSLKVIIDFVPNHLSREYNPVNTNRERLCFGENDKADYHFHPMNNYYYLPGTTFVSPVKSSNIKPYVENPARVTGNDCFKPNPSKDDWYETVKLNYGVDYSGGNLVYFQPIPDTWFKMKDVLLFWMEKGVSGLRCDMAAMVPQEFWSWIIPIVKDSFPGTIFIGEIYEPHLYDSFLQKCGFDYLYDKVGLYDTIKDITLGKKGCREITLRWQSLGALEDRMVNFLENHDEVRVASHHFASDPLGALPALAVSLLLNRSPFLLYFGQELGERGEDCEGFSRQDGKTSIFDYWSLESVRKWLNGEEEPKVRSIYRTLLNLAITEDAFFNGDKFDLNYANEHNPFYNVYNNFSFTRKGVDALFVIFAGFGKQEYRVNLVLPDEMFVYHSIEPGIICQASDIMTGEKFEIMLDPSGTTELGTTTHCIKIIKVQL